MSNRTLIALSIPRGYYARNFLRSGVLDMLLARDTALEVCILSPAWEQADFRQEFSRGGRVHFAPLHAMPKTLAWWERVIWKARRMVRRSRSLALTLDRIIQGVYLRRARHYTAFFDAYRPTLVVTGSPGFHSNREVPLIREAQARGILTLCIVFSWDNLTTHPVMPTRPDFLAVWNGYMHEEAVRDQFYAPSAVDIVGPPHFDLYQDPATFQSRDAYCRAQGLDPHRPILLVGAGDNDLVNNTFILDVLGGAIDRGALSCDVQILVRPHPMDPTNAWDKHRDNPRWTFDRRPRLSDELGWNPSREDMVHLANTLRHSDVIVNVASTIALEAAILDRPVINVCFSGPDTERFADWVLRFHYDGHYKPIKELGGCWLVWNEQELLAAIAAYREQPALHRAERHAMAEALCFRLDGQASQRVADAIYCRATGRMTMCNEGAVTHTMPAETPVQELV